MDILFTNMKVVSQLTPEKGQKLSIQDKFLVIDESIVSPLMRWIRSESRDNTLTRIHEIIKEAIQHGLNALRSIELEGYKMEPELQEWNLSRLKTTWMENRQFLHYLVTELEGMIRGIQVLQETYADDVTFTSKLRVEIQTIKTNVENFKSFLNNCKPPIAA